MNVAAPSAELKAGLAKVGEQMVADWQAEAGDTGAAIIDAFKK